MMTVMLTAETTSPLPSATLFERLATLRSELDRVVREINVLCAGCPDADKQLLELQEQFRGAVYHLEMTLDYLTPLGDQPDRPLPLATRG